MVKTDHVSKISPLGGSLGKIKRPLNPGQGLGPSFQDTLQGLNKSTEPKTKQAVGALKFSNHAVERMRSRGVSFSPQEMRNIENAVAKARDKGASNTLVLNENSALIVSVKNNTVVTLMDKASMKENVFTNIDSTVLA